MTLQEVLQSGKRFKRHNDQPDRDYEQVDSFTLEEVMATDWELCPDPVYELTEESFRSMWDSVASQFTSVKPANSSPLFQALLSKMKAS